MSSKHKQIEALCYSIIDKYKPLMFLDAHTILVKYNAEIPEGDAFWCSTNFPYFDAVLYYGEEAIVSFDEHINNKKLQRALFEHDIVHELVHIPEAGLVIKAKERYVSEAEIDRELESLTDHITKIIVSLANK